MASVRFAVSKGAESAGPSTPVDSAKDPPSRGSSSSASTSRTPPQEEPYTPMTPRTPYTPISMEALRARGRFKTRLCKWYVADGNCRFGDRCHFAHGLMDLREPFPKAWSTPGQPASLRKLVASAARDQWLAQHQYIPYGVFTPIGGQRWRDSSSSMSPSFSSQSPPFPVWVSPPRPYQRSSGTRRVVLSSGSSQENHSQSHNTAFMSSSTSMSQSPDAGVYTGGHDWLNSHGSPEEMNNIVRLMRNMMVGNE